MVQTSPTPFDVGRAFVHQYYTLLHQAPHMLHRFYSTDSTFIHGGVDRPGCVEQPAVGPDNISQRINDLNLRDCHAKIRQVDSHPTIGEGVVVQVTGELSNNGDPMRRFMQTFVLAPRQPKKYYVQNDIFRYQDEVFDEGSDEVDEDDRSSSHVDSYAVSNADKVSNADSSAAITGNSQQPLLVTATARPPIEEQQPLPPRNAGSSLGNNQQQTIPNQAARQQEQQQQQQQHAGSTNLNGFSNVGDSTGYGGLGHTHLQAQQETAQTNPQPSPRPVNHQVTQENQQQVNGGNVPNQQQNKQTAPTQPTTTTTTTTTEGQRPENTSYAGIAKMNSTTGSAPNVNSTATVVPRGGPNSSTVPPTTSQQPNAGRAPVKTPLTTTNRSNSNPQLGQQQPQQQQRNNGNYYQQNNRGNYWNDNSAQYPNSARRSGPNTGAPPSGHQIFVGSLPSDFKRETLIEFFGKYGTVLDAKIHAPNNDHKKHFAFVTFENPEVAKNLVQEEHVAYNETVRLNIEPKTRGFQGNNNSGNYNGTQGGGRNNNYQPRGGGRGGNRAPYRGSGSGGGNPRRGGGQFNHNSAPFTGGDENNNEYRTTKAQTQVQP